MSWGDRFSAAYNAATDAAKAAADQAMASVQGAADAVGHAARAAAEAGERAAAVAKDVARQAAAATRDAVTRGVAAATTGAETVGRGALAVGRGAANVGDFSLRAVQDTVSKGGALTSSVATQAYRSAKQAFAPATAPSQTAVEPCPDSWPAKKKRLEQRAALIADGQQSPDPAVRAAAARLSTDNEAVELARLSEDSYTQYPGAPFNYPNGATPPPTGWKIVSKEDLASKGVPVQALEDSRAVIYETEDDWPGGKKTVLSFRGTKDLEDAIVDHDQAMALPTAQYRAAMRAGDQVADALGPDVLVTGHSLGGGKAQAAGAVSGLRGMMFNSAGLNPSTVEGAMPAASQFLQYRSAGDPLTGVQNSPMLQTAVGALAGIVATPLGAGMKAGDALTKLFGGQGLSSEMADYADKALKALPRGIGNLVRDGNILPPAIGAIHEVPAFGADGKPMSLVSPSQHSITTVVRGIEHEKTDDASTIEAR